MIFCPNTAVNISFLSATVWTSHPAVPNTSQGPAKSMSCAPLKRRMATFGGLSSADADGTSVIPQFEQVPGLSKTSLSQGKPQGGHTYDPVAGEPAVARAPPKSGIPRQPHAKAAGALVRIKFLREQSMRCAVDFTKPSSRMIFPIVNSRCRARICPLPRSS